MIDDGISQKDVVKLLSINRSTIFRWKKRRELEGNCNFKGYNNNKDKLKIKDVSKFSKFLEDNKTLSLADMADKFECDICYTTIYKLIKKLGYSYKKNSGYILKEMKKKDKNTTKI